MASSGWRLGVDVSPVPRQANDPDGSAWQQGLLVDSPVSLRYPNGRVHETTLSRSSELRLGDRFELHGRQWSAVKSVKPSRSRAGEPGRMLCVATSCMSAPTQ